MSRTIDAEKFVTVQMYDAEREEWYKERMTIEEYIDRYTDEGCPPTIDAVEVVRCGDCEYRETCEQIVWFDIGKYKAIGSEIDFCSYGERSER